MQFLLHVADHIGHRFDGIEAPHQIENIAKLQAGLAGRYQLDTGPVEARNHHVITLFDVKIADLLAQHLLVGHHYPLHPQVGTASREGGVDLFSQHQQHLVQGMALTNQVEQVAQLDTGIRARHHQLVATLEARADDIRLVEARDLAQHQAMHVWVAYRDIDGLQALFGFTGLLLELGSFIVNLDAKEHPHQPHSEQNAADAERIGHCVPHPHQPG